MGKLPDFSHANLAFYLGIVEELQLFIVEQSGYPGLKIELVLHKDLYTVLPVLSEGDISMDFNYLMSHECHFDEG